jgi:hypothetical protein
MTDGDKKNEEKQAQAHPEQTDRSPKVSIFRRWLRSWRQSWRQTSITNRFVAVASGIVACATVIYAVVAYYQWQALLDSNRINRESLVSVQRAFVSFDTTTQEHITQRFPSGEKGGFFFAARVRNEGTTPALGISQYFGSDDLTGEPTEEQFENHVGSPSGIIGPKSPRTFGRVYKPDSFFGITKIRGRTDVDTAVSIGGKIPYYWGWMIYRDVFPNTKTHITEFCQRVFSVTVNSELGPSSPPQYGISYESCDHHNCIDETCEDYEQMIAKHGRDGSP